MVTESIYLPASQFLSHLLQISHFQMQKQPYKCLTKQFRFGTVGKSAHSHPQILSSLLCHYLVSNYEGGFYMWGCYSHWVHHVKSQLDLELCSKYKYCFTALHVLSKHSMTCLDYSYTVFTQLLRFLFALFFIFLAFAQVFRPSFFFLLYFSLSLSLDEPHPGLFFLSLLSIYIL